MQTPTLAHLLKTAIERLLDVHTALIARVERYDAEKQLVELLDRLQQFGMKKRLQIRRFEQSIIFRLGFLPFFTPNC